MRDAIADRGGPVAPRSCERLEALTSACAPALGATVGDGAAGPASTSGTFDDAVIVGAGLGALGAGVGSVTTSRGGAAGGVGAAGDAGAAGGAGTSGAEAGTGSSSTRVGVRGVTGMAGAGRGRAAAAGGTGSAGGGASAGVRASHTTRGGGAGSAVEPAATTSAPRPRWIATEHATGRATRLSVAVHSQQLVV